MNSGVSLAGFEVDGVPALPRTSFLERNNHDNFEYVLYVDQNTVVATENPIRLRLNFATVL